MTQEKQLLQHIKFVPNGTHYNIAIFFFGLYLDSAFTERVLGLPAENYKGYVEADATQRARHIPSYSFFLMHGLAGNVLT